MLVEFCGNLISTDLIYKVSKVCEVYEDVRWRSGCYDLEHRKPFLFEFKIYFLGGQSETFKEKANYDPKLLLTEDEYNWQKRLRTFIDKQMNTQSKEKKLMIFIMKYYRN
jgi:hypothetical protein